MRKRALAICLCIVLALVSVGATIAYFTDDDSAVNTFTVGKVDISLTEHQVDVIDGESVITKTTTTGFPYKLIPGNKYSKVPIVTVADDSEPCWLYVTVDNQIATLEPDADEENDRIENIREQMALCFWSSLGTYTLEGKEKVEVFAKEGVGEPDTGYKVFDYFVIDGDKANNADIAAAKDKKITIKAYAIQAAGFESAAEAWEKAHTQFN